MVTKKVVKALYYYLRWQRKAIKYGALAPTFPLRALHLQLLVSQLQVQGWVVGHLVKHPGHYVPFRDFPISQWWANVSAAGV